MNNLRVLAQIWHPTEKYVAVHAGKRLTFKTIAEVRAEAKRLGYDGIQGTFDQKELPGESRN